MMAPDMEYRATEYREALQDIASPYPNKREYGVIRLGNLGYLGDRNAISFLSRMLQSEKDENVQVSILDRLGRIGLEDALFAIRPALFDTSRWIRLGAVDAVMSVTNCFGIRHLNFKDEPDPEGTDYVRLYRQAISLLTPLTQDPDPEVREKVESHLYYCNRSLKFYSSFG